MYLADNTRAFVDKLQWFRLRWDWRDADLTYLTVWLKTAWWCSCNRKVEWLWTVMGSEVLWLGRESLICAEGIPPLFTCKAMEDGKLIDLMIVLPLRGTRIGLRNRQAGTSRGSTKRNRKLCTWEGPTTCSWCSVATHIPVLGASSAASQRVFWWKPKLPNSSVRNR